MAAGNYLASGLSQEKHPNHSGNPASLRGLFNSTVRISRSEYTSIGNRRITDPRPEPSTYATLSNGTVWVTSERTPVPELSIYATVCLYR